MLLNDLLLWEDIQRKTTAENVLKSHAITKFTKEEITAAYIHIWLQSIKFWFLKIEILFLSLHPIPDKTIALKYWTSIQIFHEKFKTEKINSLVRIFEVSISNYHRMCIGPKWLPEVVNLAISMRELKWWYHYW